MPGSKRSAGSDFPISGTNYARVRDVLRADIINAVFAPGDRLKVAELAKRYEISANPVREALQQLQGEGLVEMLPNRGARVRTLDLGFLNDWIEVREAMETFFARRFVELATPRDVAELQRIQDTLENAAQAGDMEAVQLRNSAFHTWIHDVCGNREAIAIISKNTDLVRALRRRVGFSTRRIPRIVSQHRALMRAFKARDATRADDLMRRHVVDAGADLRSQYEAITREQFAQSVESYLSRKKVPKGWRPTFPGE